MFLLAQIRRQRHPAAQDMAPLCSVGVRQSPRPWLRQAIQPCTPVICCYRGASYGPLDSRRTEW
eukprot:4440039-Amphidinium_carterae.1